MKSKYFKNFVLYDFLRVSKEDFSRGGTEANSDELQGSIYICQKHRLLLPVQSQGAWQEFASVGGWALPDPSCITKTASLPRSPPSHLKALAPHAENEQLPNAASNTSFCLQVASWNKAIAPIHILRTYTVRHWLISTESWVLSSVIKLKITIRELGS